MRASNRLPQWWADVAVASAVFAAAAVFLSLLPRNLGFSDEAYFLYEAKRIRDGEVMYRDLFEFVTPLASYTMAGLFWLFGTSMATARVATAVLHALTGVALYASSRALGARRELAVLAPLAYVALCQSAWPYASWHWFSTFFTALLLLSLLAGPWARRPRWAVVPGLIAGALICVQQQKGVVLGVGAATVLAFESGVDLFFGGRPTARSLLVRLASFAAGVAAIAVPVLLVFVLAAGWTAIYDALVRFPLEHYRSSFHSSWGAPIGPTSAYTSTTLLRYSPLAFVPCLAWWIWELVRRRDRETVARLTALLVLSGFAALSIAYFPDAIHVAFIAGLFWVAATAGLAWMLTALRPVWLSRLAGALIAAALGWVLVRQLAYYSRVLRESFPVSHDTAFGRVDFVSRSEPAFFDAVRARLDGTPARELFCYPEMVSPYLVTGATNPTPYQYLLAGVSPEHQVDETLRILEARRTPYVISWIFAPRPTDRIGQYIRERYEPVPIAPVGDERSVYVLYRRKGG